MSPANWKGIGADILQNYLKSESGESGSDAGNFGLDVFINGFEDEFPADSDDPIGGMYAGYSPEANRAAENKPWGGQFGDRPKIHELNQPQAAQALGWRVLDFYPNRDVKSDFYRLAGTPSELRQMMQLIQATRFVTGARINFEQWFEQWENGFPLANQNRSGGNFELTGDRAWERIKDPSKKPKYKEFTTSQQRADWGYRVIEYWRDQSVELNSIMLVGSDLNLIQHILQIEYEGGGSQGSQEKSNWPLIKGQPQIKLYFKGEGRAEGETSVRIMNKTDDPKIPLPQIDKNDLRQYANKIKQIFATPNLYVWRKGREIISYKNKWQGFGGQWWLCRNQVAGRELISKLLEITDQQLDPGKLRLSTAPEEAIAFPVNPPDIVVLGEAVPQNEERPLVDVAFWRAEIKLAKMRSPIALVERALVVYD